MITYLGMVPGVYSSGIFIILVGWVFMVSYLRLRLKLQFNYSLCDDYYPVALQTVTIAILFLSYLQKVEIVEMRKGGRNPDLR